MMSLNARVVTYKPNSDNRIHRRSLKTNFRVQAKAELKLPTNIKAVRPKGDYVFVKAAPEETKTPGGILLPLVATQRPTTGTVEELGDGRIGHDKKKRFNIKAGDTVLYSKMGFMYTEIEFKNSTYILIKEEDILGTFKKPSPTANDLPDLQPMHDNVLIKIQEESDVTAGGVVLPETAKERPVVGTVVRAGPGKTKDDKLVPCKVKPGDKILFFKYAGDALETTKGEKFRLLKEDDILCKA